MKLDRRPLACIWPDDVHEYLSKRWSPLSLTLIYDTVALVESWLIMCAALLIYSSKLKALVQGFLSYFQQLNNEFPLFSPLFLCNSLFRCHVAVTQLSSAADELADPIPWPFKEAPTLCWSWLQAFGFHYDPVFPSVIFRHPPSSCKFELLLIRYLCQVNSHQQATHESWITITLAHAVTSISLCFLTGDPHSC